MLPNVLAVVISWFQLNCIFSFSSTFIVEYVGHIRSLEASGIFNIVYKQNVLYCYI